MTNNIKKLCSYCLDCVKSTAKGNMKAEKTIISIDGVFNADNKWHRKLLYRGTDKGPHKDGRDSGLSGRKAYH